MEEDKNNGWDYKLSEDGSDMRKEGRIAASGKGNRIGRNFMRK